MIAVGPHRQSSQVVAAERHVVESAYPLRCAAVCTAGREYGSRRTVRTRRGGVRRDGNVSRARNVRIAPAAAAYIRRLTVGRSVFFFFFPRDCRRHTGCAPRPVCAIIMYGSIGCRNILMCVRARACPAASVLFSLTRRPVPLHVRPTLVTTHRPPDRHTCSNALRVYRAAARAFPRPATARFQTSLLYTYVFIYTHTLRYCRRRPTHTRWGAHVWASRGLRGA